MLLNKLSLKAKMLIIVGQLAVFAMCGLGFAVWSSHTLQKRFTAMINQNDYLEIVMANLSNDVNALRALELSYARENDKTLLDSIVTVTQDLDLYLSELQAIQQTYIEQSKIKSFSDGVDAFKKSLGDLVRISGEQGGVSEGLNARFLELKAKLDTFYADHPFDASRNAATLLYGSAVQFLRSHDPKDYEAFEALYKDQKKAFRGSKVVEVIEGLPVLLGELNENFKAYNAASAELKATVTTLTALNQEFTGTVRAHNEAEIKSLATSERYTSYGHMVVIGLILLISVAAIIFISRISKTLLEISESVRRSASDSKETSAELYHAAENVSDATNNQASAVEETVATLNEISAMVGRTVESAEASTQKADASLGVSRDGQVAVNKVKSSMADIQSSINSMTKQVETTNVRFESVIEIIKEISTKTQVINEIVFQTKLLSFNASVEAARAGEHGKGFAVVAEEVGNLASMSGAAAKGITEILTRSKNDVEQIMKDSRRQMEELVQESSRKVSVGMEQSDRCELVLDQVVSNVSEVQQLIREIANASKEEAQGIHNITIAMTQIDATTHTNSNMAQETKGYSHTLTNQAEHLEDTVRELDQLVRGRSTDYSSRSTPSPLKLVKSPKVEAENPKSQKTISAKNKKVVEIDKYSNSTPDEDDPRFTA